PPTSTLFPYTTLFRSQFLKRKPRRRSPGDTRFALFRAKESRRRDVRRGSMPVRASERLRYSRDPQRSPFSEIQWLGGNRSSGSRSEEHTSELQSRSDI